MGARVRCMRREPACPYHIGNRFYPECCDWNQMPQLLAQQARRVLATASELWSSPIYPCYPCDPRSIPFRGEGGDEFFKTRVVAQRIEHWIEAEQLGSERRSGERAKVRC